MIRVAQPGLFTTVQDHGRSGFYGLGFPPSGSMDRFSSDVANILVGNDRDAAVLESTFVGPTLEFESPAVVAITGAEALVDIDGAPAPLWTAFEVRKGSTLRFTGLDAGARNYLAFRGGIDCVPIMGSRSTYASSNLGGLSGEIFRSGDEFALGGASLNDDMSIGVEVPSTLRPQLTGEEEIRIVLGLCHYLLSEESQADLIHETFSVSTEANRIGYRLSGKAFTFSEREQPFGAGSDPSNVVNLGYPVGSLQSPGGEELICLMRDAVTGGGYATLATVISTDLDLLAQMKYPEAVRFKVVSIEQAVTARADRSSRLGKIRELLSNQGTI